MINDAVRTLQEQVFLEPYTRIMLVIQEQIRLVVSQEVEDGQQSSKSQTDDPPEDR